jgi:tRNA-splicing ligase RtcB
MSWCPDIEPQAQSQVDKVAALPWVARVAVMPDAHWGMGCTVGTVLGMRDALAPSTVGVDIGCGMIAAKLPFTASDLPESLAALRHSFERSVPVGFNQHNEPWSAPDVLGVEVADHMKSADNLCRPVSHGIVEKACRQVGTLGGGNHFIELSLDESSGVWVVLHSGSRNIGKELAEYHIGIAKKLLHNAELPDKDLAVFLTGTPEMDAYRHDLMWAQDFARLNREVMLRLLLKDVSYALGRPFVAETIVRCHHNYVSEENHFGEWLFVTRKGAISAAVGQLGIIPGSMGTRSYVVRGLGNADSMNSASHGAGRRMGRGVAKRTFTVADLEEQTRGVECRKDAGIVDEIPGAYKDIDVVMENQKDLVEIVHTLKAVLCVKG